MSESPDLAWVERVSEDVEEALAPAVRRVLRAMRQLHVAECEECD